MKDPKRVSKILTLTEWFHPLSFKGSIPKMALKKLTLAEWFYILKLEGLSRKEAAKFVHEVLLWPKLFKPKEITNKLNKNPVNLERLLLKLEAQPHLLIDHRTHERLRCEIIKEDPKNRKISPSVLRSMRENNWTHIEYNAFLIGKYEKLHKERLKRIKDARK